MFRPSSPVARVLLCVFVMGLSVLAASPAVALSHAAASATATPGETSPGFPANCTATPITAIPDANPFVGETGTGGDQLWMIGLGGPPAPGPGTPSPIPGTYFMGDSFAGPTEYGWFMKVRWVLPPQSPVIATVSGTNRDTGANLHFQLGDSTPVTTLQLDPSTRRLSAQDQRWADFQSYVYFPETGCYEITASWEGGGWTVTIPFVAPDPRGTPVSTPTG
jgi:hypothetical protein